MIPPALWLWPRFEARKKQVFVYCTWLGGSRSVWSRGPFFEILPLAVHVLYMRILLGDNGNEANRNPRRYQHDLSPQLTGAEPKVVVGPTHMVVGCPACEHLVLCARAFSIFWFKMQESLRGNTTPQEFGGKKEGRPNCTIDTLIPQ